MTLNVFHFVGVSEKNIPLGVPRLKEIINNAQTTKNPYMTIYLKKEVSGKRDFVERVALDLKQMYLNDIIMEEEIYYDPDLEQTVVVEDREFTRNFNNIPDIREFNGSKWSCYMLRVVLDKDLMIKRGITVYRVVQRIREVYDDTVYMEYASEYSNKCILRLRPMVEKKSENNAGEDAVLVRELLKLLKKNILVSGIEGIKKTFIRQLKDEWIIETEGLFQDFNSDV